MMYVLAIVNQKGGVGKTTTAVTLAHGLARSGARALLVDLDAQGNVADSLGLEKKGALYRALVEGHDATSGSGRTGLDVILSDKSTVKAKKIVVGESFSEYAIRKALDGVAHHYDFAVLDVAPGVDVLQVGALVAADGFVIPVALDHLAVVGAADALASFASLQEMDLGGRFLGVLPTFWERSTNESHEQLVTLASRFGRFVWPPVPKDTRVREAPAHGETLWEYAPETRAVRGVEINGGQRGGYAQVLARFQEEVKDAKAAD
jgi:chromosome partitioning protein